MAADRDACWMCRCYDRERRRCRAGKTNPRKKHLSITVAEILGPQALCILNPFREPLLLRMSEPERRFRWKPTPLEVEIIEDE